jgi:Ca2+-binding RTX toxin-like protein
MKLVVLMAVVTAVFATAAYAAVQTGTNGDDELTGTLSADEQYGRGGDDVLLGRAGNDEQYGGRGNDELYGSFGNDDQFPGAGRDFVSGGSGNDFVYAVDGQRDEIDCGAGDNDVAIVDREDIVENCEEEIVRRFNEPEEV